MIHGVRQFRYRIEKAGNDVEEVFDGSRKEPYLANMAWHAPDQSGGRTGSQSVSERYQDRPPLVRAGGPVAKLPNDDPAALDQSRMA